MSTPHRKGYLALSLTPRSEASRSAAKGKAVAGPPLGLLDDNGRGGVGVGGGEGLEDWRRLILLVCSDGGSLKEPIVLTDYQHHMGLLLMEKTQLADNFEELRKALAEAQELLKREQTAHLIAISEAEKREDNLRKALSFEKQCMADLEKALRELRAEEGQKNLESEAKLANANSLVAGIGDKSLEVRGKLHDAEAKLAEVNRKCSQLDVKMQELERRDSVLREERRSLKIEQEEHKAAFFKQREDLREWEKKLQERERRLSEDRRIINEREEKANESDRILRQKERDLQGAESRIESSTSSLKEKEEDINRRLEDLVMKEKEADSLGSILQRKEEELRALEEKLNIREKREIQKVLEEQRIILDGKLLQFESELEERRKSVDKELRSRVEEVERKEADVSHKEEKLVKREQTVDMKMERVKEKEKDLDARMKTLKEKEKSMKLEEKRLEIEKKQMLADIESLQNLKDELENIRADNAQKEMDIRKEEESLRITAEERSEHLRLQAELKMEIEKCQSQRELLLKEAEELKEERERFETEWDVLDEKRAAVTEEQRKVLEEKESLKKWQLSEEERLKRQKLETENIKRELETLRLENESLNAKMRHEELDLSEKAEDERKQMLQEFEVMKMELEASLRSRQGEVEKELLVRGRELEAQRDAELKKINELKENALRELDEARSEKLRIQKEKQNLEQNKKQLHVDQLKMREDIDQLVALSQKLKEKREKFLRERDRFHDFVEKLKSCGNCGDLTREFLLSDLQSPEMGDKEDFVLPGLVDELSKSGQINTSPLNRTAANNSSAGGPISWLRKCTLKILSPSKKIDNDVETDERTRRFSIVGVEPESSSHVRDLKSDDDVKRADDAHEQSVDNNSYLSSQMQQEVPEDSQQSRLRRGQPRTRNQRGRVYRNRSVKAVVEDARTFLGDDLPPELKHNDEVQPDDDVTNQDSPRAENASRNGRRKRQHAESSRMTGSEMHAADSEGPSDSVTVGGGGRKKRRHTAVAPSAVQTPGQTRYNLRRHRPTSSAVAVETSSDMNQEGKKEHDKCKAAKATASEVNSLPARDRDDDDGIHSRMAQVTTVKTVEEKIVRFTTADTIDENADAPAVVQTADLIEEVNDTQEFYEEEDAGNEAEEAEDDYDEEADHLGEASITKKIWTFFTT
ncbi:hypothetical protein CRG98_023674 [Punica granatum]|uniref:Protein CROWDED NUCLEI 1 n=1 Tax=Punica granatum TaxID=22663 RepID=A0A2I0JI68_PUNGR|nr:hypothetical protein CRG98_023674 [Punica granatum]